MSGQLFSISGTVRAQAIISCWAFTLGIAACAGDESVTEPSSPELTVASAASYRAVDLGALPGGRVSTAYAINAINQVVGESHTISPTGRLQNHAFLWSSGAMRDIGTLGGKWSRAFGINRAGKVVGGAATTGGDIHAFLWSAGIMRDLGTLGGASSEARAINDVGQVVGSSTIGVYPGADDLRHAFIWQNGVMKDLGTLGGNSSEAYGINPLGHVVGVSKTTDGRIHAFVWINGSMTDLGPTGGRSAAYGINRGGRIVGSSAAGPRATIWVDGVRRLWGAFGQVSVALGINSSGLAVGVSHVDGQTRAALWIHGEVTLLPGFPGDVIYGQAFAINSGGNIVGTSLKAADEQHATMWMPN